MCVCVCVSSRGSLPLAISCPEDEGRASKLPAKPCPPWGLQMCHTGWDDELVQRVGKAPGGGALLSQLNVV